MSARLRSSNAVLAVLVWSSFHSAAFAAKPESNGERPKSGQKSDLSYEVYHVKKGETLWSVAMDHHTSAGEIMDLNDMDNSRISAGQALKIPKPGASGGAPVVRQKSYIVQENDTVHGIARRYEISDDALLNANPDLNPRKLRPGTKVLIPTAGVAASQPKKDETARPKDVATSIHLVKDNETFTSIAKQHGTTVDALMAANPGVKPERLQEGMKLKVPAAAAASREGRPAKKSSAVVKPAESKDRIVTVDRPALAAAKAAPTRKVFEMTKKPSSQVEFSYEKQAVITKPNYQMQAAPRSRSRSANNVIVHSVRAGETVESIADSHGVSQKVFREFNHLRGSENVRPGEEVMIPMSSTLASR
jgi:LysM repeat protein